MTHRDPNFDDGDIAARFDGITRDLAPDPNPYENPQVNAPAGLTRRGKVALATGAALLVGGGAIAWSSYAATQAQAEVKAAELALQADRLELERIKALQEVNAPTQTRRNEDFNTCVDKALGTKDSFTSAADVIDKCNAAFPPQTSLDTEHVASHDEPEKGGIGADGLLVALAAGGVGALFLARKAKHSQ